MVVYFPQQQEKEKRKYQLICGIAPTPFPGYPRSTTVRVFFEVLLVLFICYPWSFLKDKISTCHNILKTVSCATSYSEYVAFFLYIFNLVTQSLLHCSCKWGMHRKSKWSVNYVCGLYMYFSWWCVCFLCTSGGISWRVNPGGGGHGRGHH